MNKKVTKLSMAMGICSIVVAAVNLISNPVLPIAIASIWSVAAGTVVKDYRTDKNAGTSVLCTLLLGILSYTSNPALAIPLIISEVAGLTAGISTGVYFSNNPINIKSQYDGKSSLNSRSREKDEGYKERGKEKEDMQLQEHGRTGTEDRLTNKTSQQTEKGPREIDRIYAELPMYRAAEEAKKAMKNTAGKSQIQLNKQNDEPYI
jgi:hypothetical protein